MPDSSLTLAIETSNPSSSELGWNAVAVGLVSGRGVSLLAKSALQPRDRHDDALLPAIAQACTDAGVNAADLERVAISIGPGGFTALRIAVTTAKMLSLTHGCACVAVPTAHALVRRLDRSADGDIAIALAWKRESVWIERFASPEQIISAGLERIDGLNLTGVSNVVCDERFVGVLRDGSRIPASALIQSPRFDAVAVLEASILLKPTPAEEFGPLYPREPEAVTKWRELHG